MELNYMKQLYGMALFEGIEPKDINSLLTCLGGYTHTFKKGEIIFMTGEAIKSIGVVLDGVVFMIKEDIWGSESLVAAMQASEIFGEIFACGTVSDAKVTFTANRDCKILFLTFQKVLNSCNMSCVFHHRLIENMVRLLSRKNIQLLEKIEVTSKKSLREKILTYLSMQAQAQGSLYFNIPLGRAELAAYLCADRSAVTRELSQMRKEGIVDFDKNTFHLLMKNK